MADQNPIPRTHTSTDTFWPIRAFKRFVQRIEPETIEQEQGGLEFTRAGLVKAVKSKSGAMQFGEISESSSMMIDRPGGGHSIDPAKALAHNRGFVYAAVNAKAREVMIIDWRLFEIDGKDHVEKPEHEVLDLLDTVNDNMTALEFKYLISACLDLTGSAYIYMQGVLNLLAKPKALFLMPPDKVQPVIDRRTWPEQLLGYTMRVNNNDIKFQPYEVIQIRLPNPRDFFSGMSPVEAAAQYIDNDDDAQRFNSKFFKNGARPAGFLESDFIAETQIESLKIGFAQMHQGVDNMNGIGVLPKGVKWVPNGASPKDMDFKNLSEDGKERQLAIFGVSKTILGTAESDTNRACYDDQTEVLTENGWKKYLDVQWGEKIAEYEPETDTVRLTEPTGSYCYKYKGMMAQFKNDQTDILVTPDHRMWFRPAEEQAYRIGYAEDIPDGAYFKTLIEDPWKPSPIKVEFAVQSAEFVYYDSYVWCFKTTTGLFVTRRNGKIALQGNTAETADYVFSKRVVKPHMTLICDALNQALIPRYGDNLYLTFLDPVPEDRAARTTEMQASVGSQPVLTINEAREQFMGLGPVEGGDVLMSPTIMQPSGEPTGDGDATPQADGNAQPDKAIRKGEFKAANGERVAFRLARTKLQARAKKRTVLAAELAKGIVETLKRSLATSTKTFSTPEQDEAAYKAITERAAKAEAEVAEAIRTVNADQKAEVLENLASATQKAVDPKKLFDLAAWVSVTAAAIGPILTSLYASEGKTAATEVGKPDLNPLDNAEAASALTDEISKAATSYQETTLGLLTAKINAGIDSGAGIADITASVQEVYGYSDDARAAMVAKTETFRTTNAALKATWKQSGVVKTLKWYTTSADPCVFCQDLNGKTISIDSNFLNAGDTLTVGEKTMTADYGDVGAPPCHPNCQCIARPDQIAI